MQFFSRQLVPIADLVFIKVGTIINYELTRVVALLIYTVNRFASVLSLLHVQATVRNLNALFFWPVEVLKLNVCYVEVRSDARLRHLPVLLDVGQLRMRE